MPITVSGTSITFNDATTQTTAGQPGTVTSVATGNGLSGGTITTSGTLVIACPGVNTVGSYIYAYIFANGATVTQGSNYSAGGGSGANNVQALVSGYNGCIQPFYTGSNSLSGTWKWMAATNTNRELFGIACRVA